MMKKSAARIELKNFETFVEDWIKEEVTIAPATRLKLSGPDSLYNRYTECCKQSNVSKVSIRRLALKLQIVLAAKYRCTIVKVKTGKGVCFDGVSFAEKEARELVKV